MTDTRACPVCLADGESCGVIVATDRRLPCIRCQMPTYIRSDCGVARHGGPCKPAPAGSPLFIEPPHSCTDPMCDKCPAECGNHPRDQICPDCTGGAKQANTGPHWLAQERARIRATTEQATLRAELVTAGHSAATVTRAIALWNEHMRGITYAGGHRTALGILNGAFKHKSVPDLPPVHPAELVKPGDGPVWAARSWPVYTHHTDRASALEKAWASVGCRDELCGFDINGMFLSAAASEMGTGEPVRRTDPDESVLKEPGWVRVSLLTGAPWSIQDRWSEGMWMPTPIVAYLNGLRDKGCDFLMLESYTQPEHRRWLDPHVNLLRDARTALMAFTPGVDGLDAMAAEALLPFIKDVYARMFGGLLESAKHNDTDTLRPWWKAQLSAVGQARMFRGLDKVATGTVMCVGVFIDAAWFVMPRGWEVPPGLEMSAQLGKWKPAGRTLWTAELAAAYRDGQTRPLWRALHPEAVGK